MVYKCIFLTLYRLLINKQIIMKNLLTTILAVTLFFFTANAQDELTTKKGTPILPVAGEYSIGIDATPFFSYAGNMFNGNTFNSSPGFSFTATNPMQITGKYMLDDKTAIRGSFRIGMTSVKDKEFVSEDGATDPLATVEDSWTNSQMNVGLAAGLEKRKGNGRLQGIYGAMAMLSYSSYKDVYEYGNEFSSTNTNPSRTSFNGNNIGGAWVNENKQGTTFGLSAWAFIGVEYFFAPKMSLSGEFSYGLGFSNQSSGSMSYENWDGSAVESGETETAGSSAFGLDTGIGAALNLNFYF